MVGDIACRDLLDIVVRHLPEVRLIGLPAELVPLVAVHASTVGALHGEPETSDAGEQVDEGVLVFYIHVP